ncbi:hypothetical protein SRB5_65330 [Streptomyces sp. RB5]|uniref:M23ase beta-sheet core domain-containing protein n=2 Tax=Streptomyces smaragdinus TaxID=2585196 RepID=A0A7K0CS58_9ACTN|nr:hypothetical protein [Streptomyces smaragdinus]
MVPGSDGYGYDYGYGTGSYDTVGYDTGSYTTTGYGTTDTAYTTGPQWDTGAQQAYAGYDSYGTGTGYDNGSWTGGAIPQQAGPEQSWDAQGWQDTTTAAGYDSAYQQPAAEWDTGSHGTAAGDYNSAESAYDTGSYATTGYQPADDYAGAAYASDQDGMGYGTTDDHQLADQETTSWTPERFEADHDEEDAEAERDDVVVRHEPVRNARPRRCPKRSALLKVAVPSLAVVGVAGAAAATVGQAATPDDGRSVAAAPDPASVKPTAANAVLDTQLTSATETAGDFADRASRTQERIDLRERQEAEKKRKAEEAARREALRPKFMLPVADATLSAYFGQAGVNWTVLHSGIDFPVSQGTSVRAATDGTVTTKWDNSFGNMVIVTAADGTETWYCHLSSARIRSGYVQAGDVIAYSGNTGNSTGPHLHFEVHPYGGDAIDPLPWLRNKGLPI